MPTRLIREGILTSTRVNALDDAAEVFFRRLLSVVDDYGRCEAHAALLRASLYPLKLDRVTEPRIEKLLKATADVGLITIYEVESSPGKRFLQVHNFRQQVRSTSKHPPPDDKPKLADAKHPLTDVHLGVSVSVSEVAGVLGTDGPKREVLRTLPEPLNVPAFREQWVRWVDYLTEKTYPKNVPSETFDAHLRTCLRLGALAGAESLRIAIERQLRAPAEPLLGKNSLAGGAGFDPNKPNAHTGGLPEV
jgi:hypothetical protein